VIHVVAKIMIHIVVKVMTEIGVMLYG